MPTFSFVARNLAALLSEAAKDPSQRCKHDPPDTSEGNGAYEPEFPICPDIAAIIASVQNGAVRALYPTHGSMGRPYVATTHVIDVHLSGSFARVLAAVIERDGNYLVGQRPAHKRHGRLWEFPGGKVEAGETPFEAAYRELAEELDVRVLSVGAPVFSVADPGSTFLIEFVPTTIHGSPTCLEHMDLKWMSLRDLPSLALAPSDRRFVDFLRSSQ